MNRRWIGSFITATFLLEVGCASGSSGGTKEQEQKEVLRRLQDLEAKEASMLRVHDELRNRYRDIVKQQTLLEAQVRSLSTELADLNIRLKSTPPTPGPAPALPEESDLRTIESILKALQTGEIDEAAAIGKLIPIAKTAAPVLMNELDRDLLHPQYAARIEKVLSHFPVEAARGPVAKAVEQERTRLVAVRILGALGDREFSTLLEPYLPNSDEGLRVTVCESLVLCKNPAGIKPLVGLLRSNSTDVRIIAFHTLKKLNRGKDFSYSPFTPPDRQNSALTQWEEWAETEGPKAVEGK